MSTISTWYATGDISTIKNIAPEKIICFDTETTGFGYMDKDEILQLSIVRGDGEVLFSEYVKPGNRKRWPKAQEVNGITFDMVKDKPLITEYEQQIKDIFSKAELLIAYNAEFDLNFLYKYFTYHLAENKPIFDVMLEYAPVAAQWDNYHGEWKWQKLINCAKHYSYEFDAHNAVEDTKATLHCFWAMLADDKPHSSKDKMVPYLQVVKNCAEANAEREQKEQLEQVKFETTTELTLPAGWEYLKTKKEYGDNEIYRFTLSEYKALKTVKFEEGTQGIPGAFINLPTVETLVFPKTMQGWRIESMFKGCDKINNIVFEGSTELFQSNFDNFTLQNKLPQNISVVHCSDGDLFEGINGVWGTADSPEVTFSKKTAAKEQARKKTIESLAAKYPLETLQRYKTIFLVIAIICFVLAVGTITTIVGCFLFLALGLLFFALRNNYKKAAEFKSKQE